MLSYEKALKFLSRNLRSNMTDVGLRVLRFSDRDVLENIDAVREKIWSEGS